MDFFERQDSARRQTKWLVVYFAMAVVCIIAGIYLVCAGLFLRERFVDGFAWPELWHPQLFLGVTAVTGLTILIGSASKTMALRQGGSAVAGMLGGRKIHSYTEDPDEKKLLNIVEEMALASGLAVPPVYLLPDENGINAFAAGHDPSDAVIGVTRGCVKLLNRDELQGVIAHEFSHILNGDMRLNLRLMGVVFGILCLAVVGRTLLHAGYLSGGSRSRNNQGNNVIPLLGLALIVIGSIGVFFGRLIQSAVSRQREFLADAAAVQFTRNPDGIAGALKKIGGLTAGSRLQNPHAEEASHMYFGDGLRGHWFNMLATHPPLEERIRAIDPSFDGRFPRVAPLQGSVSEAAGPANLVDVAMMHQAASSARIRRAPVRAADAIRSAGRPQAVHLEAATAWREALHPELNRAVHHPDGAPAVVYALLISRDNSVAQQQFQSLSTNGDATISNLTRQIHGLTRDLPPAARLPLVELGIAALRELSPDQYAQFRRLTALMIEADRQIDLFEYALQKFIDRHLAPVFEKRPRKVAQYYSVNALMDEFVVVLTLLARVGNPDDQAASDAYAAAVRSLDSTPFDLPPASPETSTLKHVDAALDRLALAIPPIKKRFLNAAAVAVASDGQLLPREGELLRAIADAIDCPIPPFVELHRPVETGGEPA